MPLERQLPHSHATIHLVCIQAICHLTIPCPSAEETSILFRLTLIHLCHPRSSEDLEMECFLVLTIRSSLTVSTLAEGTDKGNAKVHGEAMVSFLPWELLRVLASTQWGHLEAHLAKVPVGEVHLEAWGAGVDHREVLNQTTTSLCLPEW